MKLNRKAFTLMELLIGVLIVVILALVATPQYKRAVLKSHYTSLMPIAKKLADSNEVFYIERNNYASDLEDLPVQGQAQYPDGTKLEVGNTADHAYVLASNTNKTPHNTYVVYQKYSQNFPGNIHCEALDADEQATSLCRDSLHGTPINTGDVKSLGGEDWTAYLLSGSITGSTFDKSCEGEAETFTETCASGCGKMTATATCNPYTGEWNTPTLDASSCPAKPEDETASCSAGDGQKTRSAKCNADGTAWEWDNWDESACCSGTPPTLATPDSNRRKCIGGTSASTPVCVNGEWQFSSFSSDLNCTPGAYCGSSQIAGASNGGPCTGTYIAGEGHSTVCNALGKGTYGCSNSTFKVTDSGFGTEAGCYANADYGCANSTFEGTTNWNGSSGSAVCGAYGDASHAQHICANSTFINKALCIGTASGMCAGSTFKQGAQCRANAPGACDDTTYESGAYCEGEYCPVGSPKQGGGTW